MKAIRILSVLSISALLCMSCSKKISHSFVIYEDQNGAMTAVNIGTPKHNDPIFNYEETLSIGGEDPIPKLYMPVSVHADDYGDLYFIDENRVKRFNPSGDFLNYISREGQGPGEVMYPGLYNIYSDTLYIKQRLGNSELLNAYHLFKTNGEFIKKITPFVPAESLIPSGRNTFHSYLNQTKALYYSYSDNNDGNTITGSFSYGLADQKTLDHEPLNMNMIQVAAFTLVQLNRGMRAYARPFILQSARFAVHENLFCLLPNGKEINVFYLNGELKKSIILDLPAIPVTVQERDSIKKSLTNLQIRDSHIPSKKPLVSGIIVSDDGFIWLKHGNETDKSSQALYTYRILSQAGEYFCDQIMPVEVSQIKNGNVYGFTYKNDGTKIFKRLKLSLRQ